MEKRWMLGLVLMTAIVTLSSASITGTAAPAGSQTDNACHVLMTDMECAAYQLALSTAPSGAAFQRLVDEYRAIVRDRESSCSCNRLEMNEVLYPHVTQIALHT